VFEADFGQRTAAAALERQISDLGADDESAAYARSLVEAVVRHRDSIDARIEASAPAYPVVQLARIDRALLRSALGELLHSAATPARVVIAEWVGLARTYSGEPARRLLNGVLGRIADETGLAAPVRGAGDRESRRSRSGGTGPP
jgi:N utilization substance protein B